MATKNIDNGKYASVGYTLSGAYARIAIGAAGTIGGPGLKGGTAAAYTIANSGHVSGTGTAIQLRAGGSVSNAANGSISGGSGIVVSGAAGAVVNQGFVRSTLEGTYNSSKRTETHGYGVSLTGGAIENGTAGTIEAIGTYGIAVQIGDAGTLSNSGLITATGSHGNGVVLTAGGVVQDLGSIHAASGYGIYLEAGGIVTNAIKSSIIGVYGVEVRNAFGSVQNEGAVQGTDGGVRMFEGGSVTNTTTSALISGDDYGVRIFGAAGTVTNVGTIEAKAEISDSSQQFSGVLLEGGNVSNIGSHATISGYDAVSASGLPTTITNSGMLLGTGDYGAGVELDGGGLIVNAAGGRIESLYIGVAIDDRTASVRNAGTIKGTVSGLSVYDGGTVTNSGTAAIIVGAGTGADGIDVVSTSLFGGGPTTTLTNTGQIRGTAIGLYATAPVTATNAAQALIQGDVGVKLKGVGTIVDAGTIASSAGAAGTAISFLSASDVLVLDPTGVVKGKITGGGGLLELAGVGGTIGGLGGTITDFGQARLTAGASWLVSGANALAAKLTMAAGIDLERRRHAGALRCGQHRHVHDRRSRHDQAHRWCYRRRGGRHTRDGASAVVGRRSGDRAQSHRRRSLRHDRWRPAHRVGRHADARRCRHACRRDLVRRGRTGDERQGRSAGPLDLEWGRVAHHGYGHRHRNSIARWRQWREGNAYDERRRHARARCGRCHQD